MDFVEGKTLFDHISSKPSFSENDVADVIRQLAEILDLLHSEKIVHLDIRPTNIRIVDGKVKLQRVFYLKVLKRTKNDLKLQL